MKCGGEEESAQQTNGIRGCAIFCNSCPNIISLAAKNDMRWKKGAVPKR
jgi:hypothetical protein